MSTQLPLSIPVPPVLRCWTFVHRDNLASVFIDGQPLMTWAQGDVVSRDAAACFLRSAGFATILEIAEVFGCSSRVLFTSWSRFREGGVEALSRKRSGYLAGTRVDLAEEAAIARYFRAGETYRAIALACGCSIGHVSDVVHRLGLKEHVAQADLPLPPPEQPAELPSPDETTPTAPEPLPPTRDEPASADTDPFHRLVDRARAHAGELHDAAPMFAPGADLPWVGALLSVPGIVASGLLEEGQRFYPDFGPAFYGVRTTLLCSTLFFLLRIPRTENLKEWQPTELGRVVGLDRVPEIGTLRKKLQKLAQGPAEQWNDAVVRRRFSANDEDALAWLYLDGHVRVYSGDRKLPATHVARMRIAHPAVQDIWVHDKDGAPLLLMTQVAHPSLAQVIEPLLSEVEEVTGRRGGTVVFDRGGWSPDLFVKLIEDGYDVLTYRKGKAEDLGEEHWEEVRSPDGKETWLLSECCLRVGKPGVPMRQITLKQDDHRTEIVTTRMDLPAASLAARMFARWRQENFFKYMRDEFDIDGLVEYGEEADDPDRDIPNPERARLEKAIRTAKTKLGNALRRAKDFEVARAELAAMEARRAGIPTRTRVGNLPVPTVLLPTRRQNLVAALKIAAWHVETGLVAALPPSWRRAEDEGRTLVAAALRSRGSIAVRDGELRVTLAAQSTPARTRLLEGLCATLDETKTLFPGTPLTMRFAVNPTTQWGYGRPEIP